MLFQMVRTIILASATDFRTLVRLGQVFMQEFMVFEVRLKFEDTRTALTSKGPEVDLEVYICLT